MYPSGASGVSHPQKVSIVATAGSKGVSYQPLGLCTATSVGVTVTWSFGLCKASSVWFIPRGPAGTFSNSFVPQGCSITYLPATGVSTRHLNRLNTNCLPSLRDSSAVAYTPSIALTNNAFPPPGKSIVAWHE